MEQPLAKSPSKKSRSSGSSRGSTHGNRKGSNKSTKRSSKRASQRSLPKRQKNTYRSKVVAWLEPRLLLITTGVTLLGVFLQIIAISTDSWIILDSPPESVKNISGKYLLELYTGLWRFCKIELSKTINVEGKPIEEEVSTCENHKLFSTAEDESEENKEYDQQHIETDVKDMLQTDYTRTAIAFTIIAIVIMTIGHAFAFYALRRPRYIIKRLAALLHFMAAACLLVLNEVFVKTVEHESDIQSGGIPAGSTTRYGYSFVLSWLVFVFFVLAGLVFLFMSQKKKAEHADSNEAEEDEPVEIFRR